MTRDDVILMAIEAEFHPAEADCHYERLHRFAALVAQQEREVCAKVCDGLAYVHVGGFAKRRSENTDCANAIRARGEK